MSGTIVADTARHARDVLRSGGLIIHDVSAMREGRRSIRLAASRLHRHRARLPDFFRELSTLLAVGVPLMAALETITREHRGGFRDILLGLRDRISGGVSLADAMREAPEVFDDLFCLPDLLRGELFSVALLEPPQLFGVLDGLPDLLQGLRIRSFAGDPHHFFDLFPVQALFSDLTQGLPWAPE